MQVETQQELREWTELITIGRVAKSQGRKGEVAVNPLTDFPERFLDLRRVFVEGERGQPASLTMEAARFPSRSPSAAIRWTKSRRGRGTR